MVYLCQRLSISTASEYIDIFQQEKLIDLCYRELVQ